MAASPLHALKDRLQFWLKKPLEDKATSFQDKVDRIKDFIFETRHGLSYSGFISSAELVTDHSMSASHAYGYQPVPTTWLRILVGEAVKSGIRFDRFVDIGAGEGKACLYAARTGHFREIIGVEFSRPLLDIACDNARKCGFQNNVKFVHIDAAAFALPKGSNLIFIYNSFDQTIIEKFVQNNLALFKEQQSWIAYAINSHRNTIIKLGFETMYRNQRLCQSLYRYDLTQA